MSSASRRSICWRIHARWFIHMLRPKEMRNEALTLRDFLCGPCGGTIDSDLQEPEVSAASSSQDPRAGGIYSVERHATAAAGGSRTAVDPGLGPGTNRKPA